MPDLPDGLYDEREKGCPDEILRYGHGHKVDGKVENRRDAH